MAKYKLPHFLTGEETPVEGEVAFRTHFAGKIIVGIDEVGRGPLAGPVVACAAVLKAPDVLPSLNDSKKLTRPRREAMFEDVKEACLCYAIASASVDEIDSINILEADFLAMRRALAALGMPGLSASEPEIPVEVKGSFDDCVAAFNAQVSSVDFFTAPSPEVLIAVDGNLKIHGVPDAVQQPVVKGDGLVASISAASILAKVFRDRYMDKLAEAYPGYGFEKHAGYGTKSHLEAIRKLGFTPEHRKSFHPKGLDF
ncbi:MAG: ribonuclease HII [Fibrobacteraceae bacterium]|nr:ribonuclease HII [Fibrobacteraceae bacterium]